jgi:hypothetical protein
MSSPNSEHRTQKGWDMGSNLMPRLGSALDALRAERGTVPREVVRAVQGEHGLGLVRAARVDAGMHVARTALNNTALLTKDEEMYLQLAPLGEARYRAIVDAYAIAAAMEAGRL